MLETSDLMDAFSQVVVQRNADCAAIAEKEGARFIDILANSLHVPVQWSVGSPADYNAFQSRPGIAATTFNVEFPRAFIDLERKEMRGEELTAQEIETKQELHDTMIEEMEFAGHSVMETIKFKEHPTALCGITVIMVLEMPISKESLPILVGSAVCEY